MYCTYISADVCLLYPRAETPKKVGLNHPMNKSGWTAQLDLRIKDRFQRHGVARRRKMFMHAPQTHVSTAGRVQRYPMPRNRTAEIFCFNSFGETESCVNDVVANKSNRLSKIGISPPPRQLGTVKSSSFLNPRIDRQVCIDFLIYAFFANVSLGMDISKVSGIWLVGCHQSGMSHPTLRV